MRSVLEPWQAVDPSLATQLVKDTRSVEGWFSTEAALLFGLIDDVQRRGGVSGDLFEIGVHHGKSAVVLAAMARAEETLGVCDLFGTQELNLSSSGRGDRAAFERTINTFARSAHIRIFDQPSGTLEPEQIGTSHRFFHVDGGHLAHEALADLRLAAAATGEAGVIAVDDAIDERWPGVIEAIVRFMTEDERWVPLVLGFSKMLLARRAAASMYLDALDDADTRLRYGLVSPWEFTSHRFMGAEMRLFSWPHDLLRRREWRARAVHLYAVTPWMHTAALSPIRSVARAILR